MNEFEESAKALNEFAVGSATEAADELSRAFEIAGDRIAQALEKAAKTGEFSFNAMASSIAQDLTRLFVGDLIVDPITDAISGAFGGLFGSSGGLTGGGINGGGATTVNLNISGVSDSGALAKSQGQISSSITRAVASGQRYR